MPNEVSRETCHATNFVVSDCQKSSIANNNNVKNKAKVVHFGTNSFYSTRDNNISISDLRKERLIKSRVSQHRLSKLDVKNKNATRIKAISQSDKKVKKNCRQTGSQHRRKIDSQKQTVSPVQTRLAKKKKIHSYDFCSSSVENSDSIPSLPNSSSKETKVKTCTDDSVSTKRFFTSRTTVSNEDKLPMMICKGRHFHLAFTRGLNKKALVTKKNTKQIIKKEKRYDNQKRKKTPLSVSVKAAKNISKIMPDKQLQSSLLNIKPLSIILTRENFPHYVRLASEQANSKENEKSQNSDMVQEERRNSLSVMDDYLSVPEEITKENVDPAFHTSTPLKLGRHPCLVLGSCSPMKKNENNSLVSRSSVNLELSSHFPLRKLNYDTKSFSNEKTYTRMPNYSIVALNANQIVTENKTIPSLKFFSKKVASDPLQLIIDAGQKNLETKQCTACHMLYTPGDLQDDKTHKKYHESYIAKLKFPAWKKERILGDFPDGRIIMIVSSDAKYMLQKVKDIQQVVDKELGVSGGIQTKSNASYILFITMDHKVAGFVVIEKISQAYRVISDPINIVGYGSPKKVLYSEREPVPALCGICRLWTSPDYRRHKIATRMLDCLRCHFIFGYLLSMDEIAFLDPTIDGRQFVETYTRTPNYLIYFKT